MYTFEENTIKESDEWKALNKIWKSCDVEQRKNCSSEFKVLSEFIKTKPYFKKAKKLKMSKPCYKLPKATSSLSAETKEFMLNLNTKGEKDIYCSIMSVINNKPYFTKSELKRYYFDKYAIRRPYLKDFQNEVCEIIDLCWDKTHK